MANRKAKPDLQTSFDRWRDEVVNDIFDFMAVAEWSVRDMSDHAKISSSCIYRLRKRATREPRASTLYKLAKSLGLEPSFTEK